MLPSIESERLYLCPPTLADTPELLQLDQDPEVMRHVGGISFDGEARARERLAQVIARYESLAGLGLGICRARADHRFVGWLALKPCRIAALVAAGAQGEPAEHIELGYRLMRCHWGHGYATEMARELLKHGFDQLGLEEVVAVTVAANRASVRVLEKLGFTPRGRGVYHGESVEVYASRARTANASRSPA